MIKMEVLFMKVIILIIKNEGIGKLIYENGNYYIGQFKNDLANGKGIVYDKNGSIIYKGDFINDKREGNGKIFDKDGNYYIGHFKDDLANGKGIVYYKNGNIMYEGDFLNGKKEGNGKYNYEDGNYYIGQYLKMIYQMVKEDIIKIKILKMKGIL